MGISSISDVIPCSPQKSSISCVSRMPPMAEPERRRRLIRKLNAATGVGRFAWGRREQHGVRAKSMGKFHAHVPQATKPDNADLLSFADLPMAQRRIGGDAGTEK